ncbi:MAG: ABC transporter ATP-binding protein [Piscinibacter sp.]
MSHDAMLEVHVRRKRFGAKDVLRDVRLSLREGEIVSLVGASGCGKSTLLRIVAGLDREAEARVTLDGTPVGAPLRQIRVVFQEPRLFPWLSVARNVAFDLGGRRFDRARVETLLDEVGLAALGERLPKQLSGGQAQRVAIARALFVQPRLLLLDEPFSAVDAFTRLKLQALLLKVARAHGITVLLVTHDIAEAVQLSDRVLVLEADPGRIAAELALALPHPREHDQIDTALAVAQVRQALHAAHAL